MGRASLGDLESTMNKYLLGYTEHYLSNCACTCLSDGATNGTHRAWQMRLSYVATNSAPPIAIT